MDKTKKARLTKKGWAFGSAESFLRLTPEESAYIEIRLSLARELKREAALSSDPRFLKRLAAARRELRAGKGIRLEELPR